MVRLICPRNQGPYRTGPTGIGCLHLVLDHMRQGRLDHLPGMFQSPLWTDKPLMSFPPRARGWTWFWDSDEGCVGVSPAGAGMDPRGVHRALPRCTAGIYGIRPDLPAKDPTSLYHNSEASPVSRRVRVKYRFRGNSFPTGAARESGSGQGKPGLQRPRNDRRFPPPGVTPVPSYG